MHCSGRRNRMECPLNETGQLRKRNCTRENCEWWLENDHMCAIKALAIDNLVSLRKKEDA